MVSNPFLEQKKLEVQSERALLTKEKSDIELKIKAIGVSKNRAYSLRLKHLSLSEEDENVMNYRDGLVKRKMEIDNLIIGVNNKLREIGRAQDASINHKIIEIFRENFTKTQMIEIRTEAERRMKGGEPCGLSFSIKDSVKNKEDAGRYKRLSEQQLEKMKEFRILLTTVIKNGCDKFDPTEFMKVISPLNRLIIPLDELAKIKRRHFV